jgi:hypothetical protein
MTLAESLLPKLGEWSPAGGGRHSWSAAFPAEGWTVRLAADKADTLACLVWELALTRTAEAPAALTLKGWAEATASRVTGLAEPLSVYEVDEARGEAILRSDSPSRKGEVLSYFEVRLAGLASATVRRYNSIRTESSRNQIAFPITHEALAKLAGDIAG